MPPSHSALLTAYLELNGDPLALCARFSLTPVQLLALIEDPVFHSRLQKVQEDLHRAAAMKYQAIAADALLHVMNHTTDPLERRRAAKSLALLARQMGTLAPCPARRELPAPAHHHTPRPCFYLQTRRRRHTARP